MKTKLLFCSIIILFAGCRQNSPVYENATDVTIADFKKVEAGGDYEKIGTAMEDMDAFIVYGAFENKDYLLLDIARLANMEEKEYGIWLFDNKTEKSLKVHYGADSPEFLALGIPVGLTEDNEVVFIGNGEFMEGISGYKCFSGMDPESLEGMNIIRLKIDI